jgi:hypothetical protein
MFLGNRVEMLTQSVHLWSHGFRFGERSPASTVKLILSLPSPPRTVLNQMALKKKASLSQVGMLLVALVVDLFLSRTQFHLGP